MYHTPCCVVFNQDDDEEEEGGGSRKRPKASRFIDDIAAVDSDEEEEEADVSSCPCKAGATGSVVAGSKDVEQVTSGTGHSLGSSQLVNAVLLVICLQAQHALLQMIAVTEGCSGYEGIDTVECAHADVAAC